jgi:uncharacterized membrane protein YgcG
MSKSKLEQWIRAILNEDADNLSLCSIRTLQMIKHEFERLQKENEQLKEKMSNSDSSFETLNFPDTLGEDLLKGNSDFDFGGGSSGGAGATGDW